MSGSATTTTPASGAPRASVTVTDSAEEADSQPRRCKNRAGHHTGGERGASTMHNVGRLERPTLTSFKNRLLILIVSLMALAQGVTIVLTLASIRSAVHEESIRQLAATRAMLDRTLAERARLLRAAVDAMVGDFAFREAVATDDPPTMQSALEQPGRQDRCGPRGAVCARRTVLTATTAELAEQAGASLRLPEGSRAAPFAVVGGRPYQIVFAPLRAPAGHRLGRARLCAGPAARAAACRAGRHRGELRVPRTGRFQRHHLDARRRGRRRTGGTTARRAAKRRPGALGRSPAIST